MIGNKLDEYLGNYQRRFKIELELNKNKSSEDQNLSTRSVCRLDDLVSSSSSEQISLSKKSSKRKDTTKKQTPRERSPISRHHRGVSRVPSDPRISDDPRSADPGVSKNYREKLRERSSRTRFTAKSRTGEPAKSRRTMVESSVSRSESDARGRSPTKRTPRPTERKSRSSVRRNIEHDKASPVRQRSPICEPVRQRSPIREPVRRRSPIRERRPSPPKSTQPSSSKMNHHELSMRSDPRHDHVDDQARKNSVRNETPQQEPPQPNSSLSIQREELQAVASLFGQISKTFAKYL